MRIYRALWSLLWHLIVPFRCAGRYKVIGIVNRETEHPVAFKSPDHIAPKGTATNNSTNRKFVLHMDKKVRREFVDTVPRMMDLGCSGGQLVADFMTLGWIGVGLEGSDYSLKHRRANWAQLSNTRLFTCDITKPYQVTLNSNAASFHLITAWEVMEHIATVDLAPVFDNIIKHLEPGGYLIASTTETPDINNGIELHQTQWTNARWRSWVGVSYPQLEYVDMGLRIYQFVRYNFLHPSFLTYRKVA